MVLLHDPGVRSKLEQRVRTLRLDSKPRWGKMSIDQMMWHVNGGLAIALGDIEPPAARPPLPRGLVKFMVLRLPWMKNAPTAPSLVAKARHDFEAERTRCLDLIQRLAALPLERAWASHPTFGKMSGTEVSALQAKHLDHHLKQFGA